MTPLNIVFAADRGYCPHVATAMCSLFENNRELRMNVYVINVDIDATSWAGLEAIAKRYGQNLIDAKISDHELQGIQTFHHFTTANFYRLFIPEKVEGSKALYLDSDIVVHGSIADLYNTSIEDYYLAGVVNPGFNGHEDLEMSAESKYFNSGVMMLNLEEWRQARVKDRVLDLVKKKPWAAQFADQCGINGVVNGRWKELHPKFNLQGYFFENPVDTCSPLFPDGNLVAAMNDPSIIHFSGSVKPWHYLCRHPYRGLYWKYLRKTPFKYYLPTDFTLAGVMKSLLPKGVKGALKSRLRKGLEHTS